MNLATLSTEQLEQLILQAGIERLKRTPEFPLEAPKQVQAFPDPAWLITGHLQGAALNIRHPGYGWLAFMIPPHEAIKMRDTLNRICSGLKYDPPTSSAPASH